MDRTKEAGSQGEPLFLDVVDALSDAFAAGKIKAMPRVIGGRYGLSSKEYTPAMAKAVFENAEKAEPKTRFTVGITDDVTNLSLDVDASRFSYHFLLKKSTVENLPKIKPFDFRSKSLSS